MSGGVLVIVDRLGRTSRRFTLSQGLATLGRDPDNDIRIALPEVASHHATVVIHDAQAVIRSTSDGETLVNGRAVSVAQLQHGDVISIGGRALRWEYSNPRAAGPRPRPNMIRIPSLIREAVVRRGRGARERGGSMPAASPVRDRAVQLALEMAHRVSMPGSTRGKQVAIVQPQRRDAGDHTEKSPARASPLPTRRSNNEPSTSVETSRTSPNLQNTTKATLWIESRKTSPRRRVQTPPQISPGRRSLPNKKSTPLRLTVLKKAQSAVKSKVIKIEAPSTIDYTKQAAIMLMTGHTPRSKLSITPKNKSSSNKSPLYLVKKPSPVRKTPRGKSGRSKSAGTDIGVTPSRGSDFTQQSANRRSSKRYTGDQSVSVLEITDSTQNSIGRASNISTRSGKSPKKSPSLLSPKKSAMKDRSKKSFRKTESIKFDLSNLENQRKSDAVTDTMQFLSDESDITLRYSESSAYSQSPSPRRSIHSRSGRMLEQVGITLTPTQASPSRTMTSDSPQARRSLRGSAMVHKVMEASIASDRTRSDLSTTVASDRTRSDLSTTVASDRTRSRLSAKSIASDRTRSDLSEMLASDRTRSDLSATLASDRTRSDISANTIAPDRTRSRISANATLASAFRTRTLSPRHNLESYSVVDLVSFDSEDATKSIYDSANSTDTSAFGTPAVSGRKTRSTINPVLLGSSTPYAGRGRSTRSKSSSNTTRNERTSVVSTRRSKSLTTPENGQPVVVTRVSRASRSRSRIHDDLSLLDQTEPDDSSPRTSKRSRTNVSETIDISNVDFTVDKGATTPENRGSPEMAGTPVLSIRSLLDSSRGSVTSPAKDRNCERETTAAPARRSRLRLTREPAASEDEGIVTPTSAAKPSPEVVKNKHSSAKKPQSKRSMIDDLNRSDIVKQLFGSPVKRKLTQSMTEFSRKQLFEEDEDERPARRPTRRTLATAPSAPSLVATDDASGDSRRDTRKRKSAKNDLTDVRGVKAVFRKSPRDDLRRVSGVGTLLRKRSPRNDLTDVRGVRKLFQKKSPTNDLRNVSGVKRLLRTSLKNDLTDVRGVRRMFKGEKRQASYQDVSGIEELFQSRDLSADKSEELFDALVGRPPIKAVYSRTFTGREARRPKTRRLSLRPSVNLNNVEEWLERELSRNLLSEPPASRRETMELRKLATDTVEGAEPSLARKSRNNTLKLTSGVRSASSTSKLSPLRGSPVRARPVRAVHSTPLKGLQLTMNASELGRVSPIAGPSRANYPQIEQDCFVSISTQMTHEEKALRAKMRSSLKQKSSKKMELSKSKESPEKSKSRATRNRKVAETAVTNTKKRRSSLVVTKKAPVMSAKGDPKTLTADSQKESPKGGTSRTRARAAKATLVVTKPSPELKPRRGAKAAAPPQTARDNVTGARKVTEKKPESPKASPKAKRKTRANASKNEPQIKSSRTKVEELAVVEQRPQQKRTRKTNAVESNVEETSQTLLNTVVRTRRGKAVPAKLETGTKQTSSRGKKVQNQTNVQSETDKKQPNIRGRKAQNQTIAATNSDITEKKTNTRVRKAQNQTSVQANLQSKTDEKQPNIRGRKAQNQTIAVTNSDTTEKRTNTRARKAQIETIVLSETEEKKTSARGKKVQFKNLETEPTTRRGRKTKQEENESKARSNTAQSPPSERSQPVARGRRAKSDVTVIETKRGKRKAANEVDPSNTVPPKRGKMAEEPAETSAKQKATKSKDNKVKNSKQETTKAVRAIRSKPAESPVKMETKRARGRKVAEPKEKVVESTRGKRKAIMDPSPAKAAAKKAATVSVTTPAPRARRAVRAKPLPEVATKVVRGRRR